MSFALQPKRKAEVDHSTTKKLSNSVTEAMNMAGPPGAGSNGILMTPDCLLSATDDKYDGVVVDAQQLPTGVEEFTTRLQISLTYWRSVGKKGIWLKLPLSHSMLVPHAVNMGFVYHHAEVNYLMLTAWLSPLPSTLPPNATHQVGVGAFVMNPDKQVLVVQEKTGPLSGLKVWKMPTGLLHQSEDIPTGVIREVKEETGIDCSFLEIITFRQSHKMAFEKSDLFFVCGLRPLTFDIKIQEEEIEDAKWMSVEELLSQPILPQRQVFSHIFELCVAYSEGKYRGFGAKKYPSIVAIQPPMNLYYSQTHDST